ncbi:MAG TPA: HEAT repeat domain-containing protein [Planctomycetota bacterium]|nr:HEAT repeat domain-containing protein [Planctomycetota bacterium]
MDNYYANIAWTIDAIILILIGLVSAAIIVYALISEQYFIRRKHDLMTIKNNLKNTDFFEWANGSVCPLLIDNSSNSRILSLSKEKGAVIPVHFEQRFKNCLVTSKKIDQIEKTARRSRNKWRRIEALLIVGYGNTSSALEILKEGLSSKDDDIYYFSLLSLGQIKSVMSARILIDFMGKRAFSGYRIIALLEKFPASIVNEVVRGIESANPTVRFWSVKLLSKLKPVQLVKRIEKLTWDESADIRAASCECLGELGMEEAKESVLRCLSDNAWFTRMHAARALAKILDKDSIPLLLPLLKDSAPEVRNSVKKIMAQYITASLPYIEKYLLGNEYDETIKKECAEVLEDAGYFTELFNNILTGDTGAAHNSTKLLEELVKTHAHLGLETTLSGFSIEARQKILGVISGVDKDMAEHIDKKINHLIEEL